MRTPPPWAPASSPAFAAANPPPHAPRLPPCPQVHHGNGTEACVAGTAPRTLRVPFSSAMAEGVTVHHTWQPWLGEGDADNIFFASVQGYGVKMPGSEVFVYPGSGDTADTEELRRKRAAAKAAKAAREAAGGGKAAGGGGAGQEGGGAAAEGGNAPAPAPVAAAEIKEEPAPSADSGSVLVGGGMATRGSMVLRVASLRPTLWSGSPAHRAPTFQRARSNTRVPFT
jgi:hypothetical protein